MILSPCIYNVDQYNIVADWNLLFKVKMDVSSTEESEASDDSGIWMSVLKCYICGDLFRKPRILPCGHTFCSDCLLTLRDEVAAEFKRKYKNACRRGESGFMTCPYPDCDYSIRIMNLRRWGLKNKAAAEAVGMLRKRSHYRKVNNIFYWFRSCWKNYICCPTA